MTINDLGYSSIYILTALSFVLFRFGMISKGNSKELIEFVGGSLLLVSFVLMFIFFGLKHGGVLLIVFVLVITPTGEWIVRDLSKKLYGK